MERIFWTECPGCHGKFYCNYEDMRHSTVKLMCPFCRARFAPDESAWLDERPTASDVRESNPLRPDAAGTTVKPPPE